MDNIEEYLSGFYPSTANNFFDRLERQVASLENTPYMYEAYEEDSFFRRMVIGDYNLFYSVDEDDEIETVHRIFHHSRLVSRNLLMHRIT